MAAVTADDEIGADGQRAVRRLGAQSDDPAALLDQIGRLRLHAQVEGLVALAVLGKEIEKVPLRHQGDIFAMRRQMAEIDHRQMLGADLSAQGL